MTEVTMDDDGFDIEEALRNVHSAGSRPKVERALVFLPESMRAEQNPKKTERTVPQQLPLKPKLPDWSILNDPNRVQTSAQGRATVEVLATEAEKQKLRKVYEKRGIQAAIKAGEKIGLYPYQVKELLTREVYRGQTLTDKDGRLLPALQIEALQMYRSGKHGSSELARFYGVPHQVILELLNQYPNGSPLPSEGPTIAEALQGRLGGFRVGPPTPEELHGRNGHKFGCSVCGSTTVMCREDGSPFDHKCKHKMWCRTINGHAKCAECAKEQQHVAEADLVREADIRRQFAENVRKADEQAPRVGYDLVEVVAPATCPICHDLLQGKRAVRVWVWDKEGRTWKLNNYQCVTHHKPGVPMSELSGQYFGESPRNKDWVHLTRVGHAEGGGARYRVLNHQQVVVWEKWVGPAQPKTDHLAAEREMEQVAKDVANGARVGVDVPF
jgi:hypothetical protein